MTYAQPDARLLPLAPFAALLLFLAPAVELEWRGGTGYCFFALFLIAAVNLAAGRLGDGLAALRSHPWYTTGMLAFTVVIPLQWALLGFVDARQLDALSRFALALPIFLLLRRLPSRRLGAIGWGCAAGALAVGAQAITHRPVGGWNLAQRLGNAYTNAIPFGDTALLLGVLAVFTLGWTGRAGLPAKVLRLAALLSGAYASYLSGSRGGWIAIPAFALLLAAEYRWHADRRRLLTAAAAALLVVGALGTTTVVRDRAADAVRDVQAMNAGDNGLTSIGARLKLWKASVALFERHPLLGVGKGRLEPALADMAHRGQLPAYAVNERAHSDFFSALAELGALGPLCLALLYAGMTQPFWRHRRAADPTVRTAAYSGLAVAAATVIFGLTIDTLVPVMVAVLLALLSATFLATIDARCRELAAQAPGGHVV